MPTSQSLEELCGRLKASDREALGGVFRLLRDDLLRYVRSIVGSDAVAHDLVQDVFIFLWELREALDPSQSLKAYLYRMARNRAYRHLRDERVHRGKQPLLQEQAAAQRTEQPDDRLAASVLGRSLQAWIRALPPRQQEALVLSRFHALSHREIASIMDVSPRTVNNHIMRALESLQGRIQAFEPTLLER